MNITKPKPFFCTIRSICTRFYYWLMLPYLTLPGKQDLLLPLIVFFLLLGGCKTVPIQDRHLAEQGGLWELDEHTASRFHHRTIANDEIIGLMYASGKSVLLNGAQLKNSSKIKNNSFVRTGPQSNARLEFKASDFSCLIHVNELNLGNAYVDTADCQHNIETLHAMIQAKNAILHVTVSQHQTEVIVISGMIKVMLRENSAQAIDVKEEQEIVVTHDTVNHPHTIAPDDIWQRIHWRTGFELYKTVIDWEKIITGVMIVVVLAAAILLPRSGSHSGLPRHHRWR